MLLVAWSGVALGPSGPASSLFGSVGHFPIGGSGGTAIATVMLVLGLVMVFGSWVLLGLLLRVGDSLRPLAWTAVAWSLPLLLGPPIYSRDVYSYAALGRMVGAHLNPYEVGPASLGASQYLSGVSSAWLYTHSPYGPGFIGLCATLVRAAGGSVTAAVFGLRLVELVGLALIGVSLPRLAKRAHKDPARALWLGVCNPFVLLHCIGGAHNEAIMIGLILAGLALADADHRVLGLLCCVGAASIKAPALIGAAFIVVDAVRSEPRERRVATAARLCAVGLVAFVALTWMVGLGWGWVKALSVPGTTHLLLTPTTFLAQLGSDVFGHDAATLSATRALGTIATALAVAYLLWRATKIGSTRACGLALAAVVAFGPIVLPWYALWAIVVLAAAGRRIERGIAIFASIVLTIALEPSGAAMPDVLLIITLLTLATAALIAAMPRTRQWIRHDLAVAIDLYRRRGDAKGVLDIPRRALLDSRATTPARANRQAPGLEVKSLLRRACWARRRRWRGTAIRASIPKPQGCPRIRRLTW